MYCRTHQHWNTYRAWLCIAPPLVLAHLADSCGSAPFFTEVTHVTTALRSTWMSLPIPKQHTSWHLQTEPVFKNFFTRPNRKDPLRPPTLLRMLQKHSGYTPWNISEARPNRFKEKKVRAILPLQFFLEGHGTVQPIWNTGEQDMRFSYSSSETDFS